MSISPTVRKRVLMVSSGLTAVLFSLFTILAVVAADMTAGNNLWLTGGLLLLMLVFAPMIDFVFTHAVRKEAPRYFCKRRDRTPTEAQWIKSYPRRQLNAKPNAIKLLLMFAGLAVYIQMASALQNVSDSSLLIAGSIFLFGFLLGGFCGYVGMQLRLAGVEDFLATTQRKEIVGNNP